MRKMILALTAAIFVILFISGPIIFGQEPYKEIKEKTEILMPCPTPSIEKWQWIKEEKVIFNSEYQSGLIARWYKNPDSEQSEGITISVFYKDGTEYLFRKFWNNADGRIKIADLLDNKKWACNDTDSRELPQQGFLLDDLRWVLLAMGFYFLPDKMPIETLEEYVVIGLDENDIPITSEEFKVTLHFNKNSANDPGPIKPNQNPGLKDSRGTLSERATLNLKFGKGNSIFKKEFYRIYAVN